jgi:hypothetical protein
MKTIHRMIPFGVGAFFAGFLTCYWLVRQSEPAAPSRTVTAAPPLAMRNPPTQPGFPELVMPAVSNQTNWKTNWMHHYRGPRHFDGGMPDLRSGYYDLFDPRYQPDIDLEKLK